MPKKPSVPSYRLHKARNLAVVTLEGKAHYLGAFGSPESYLAYNATIAEWTRKQSLSPREDATAADSYTCGRLALDYLAHAETYYAKDGRVTSEVSVIKQALIALVALYETEPAAKFGPVKLKNVRQHLIDQGKTRSYINDLVDRLKRMFKWGASEELVTAAVHHGLQTVDGLKKGRSDAPETKPVKAVAEKTVNETMQHLSGVLADMVRVQLLTGMRPGEIVLLRPRDIDKREDGLWTYRPERHKTEHRGKDRCIVIGPKAQEILSDYLSRGAEAYCFSPVESVRQYYAVRKAQRASRPTPSQRARKPKAKPNRAPSVRYTSASYRRAIERACEIAFEMPAELRKPVAARDAPSSVQPGNMLPEAPAEHLERMRKAAEWRKAHCWSPNQLRHTAGTRIRKQFGLDSAQVVLGHSGAKTTEIYAELNLEKAAEVMQRIG